MLEIKKKVLDHSLFGQKTPYKLYRESVGQIITIEEIGLKNENV